MFQSSADARSNEQLARHFPTRVGFGERWLADAVLELFREDIARFRVIMTTDVHDDPRAVLARRDAATLGAAAARIVQVQHRVEPYLCRRNLPPRALQQHAAENDEQTEE